MAAKWTKEKSVVWTELDNGALLIDAKSGTRWALNATAAALWSWCDGESSLNVLAAKLARSSRRTLREAKAEVRAFCESFGTRNLLVLAARSSTEQANGRLLRGTQCAFSGLDAAASLNALGLGHGPRVRPGPRGNSGPG